jgi:hypothetical protein
MFRKVVSGTLLAVFWTAFAAHAEVAFVDSSASLPVHQSYEGGWTHFVGGGVAVFDCNDDRFPDFYAAGGAAPSRLFVNRSTAAGEITFEAAEIEGLTEVTGAYPLDVDGDGVLDLVVLRVGANVLLKGQGDCRFAPAPDDWAFDGGSEWTTSFSATFEAGQDWPTLVFGNYVDETNPAGPFEACDRNYLIRPNGRTFGPRIPLEPGFCALSMLISDWKRTGTPELRISNDRQYYVSNGREQMWRLNPLSEYTEADGWPTLKLWGMGIASRDITGDGLPEVMLTSMGDQPLQLNRGGGAMEAAPYGIGTYATTPYMGDDGRPSTGWHAEFADVNNDGLDDLFIAKGNVEQMPSNAIHDPNNLLIQQPDGNFVEMGGVTGVGTTERSRGAALVDLNRDGRLDLIVVNRRAPVEIWRNATEGAGNWLEVDLGESGPNSRAVGAFVEVRLPDGRILTREVTVGGGHASGAAVPMHFGLGAAQTVEFRVTWPGGPASDWTAAEAGRIIRVAPGTGTALAVKTENMP